MSLGSLRSFGYGLLLTGFSGAISWAAALWGFRNTYYVAAMLPVFMTLYLLLAWLIYLKGTAFPGSGPGTLRAIPVMGHREDEPAGDLPEDKVSGAELLGLRDEDGLVRRRPAQQDRKREPSLASPVAILLWSACQLAALAAVLYSFGIGARYFTRP